ncbi:MAG: methyltransferase domain-containing protein [Alphaproteobacteria bacterium]|nr:MAG: methyltransferase domain-containing protein [Alphaproteobacteria bacterium]
MSTFGSAFTGSVPQYYDRGLVPNIFEDFADMLVAQAAPFAPDILLELASGTGAVSQKLRAAFPDGTKLICSDLNAPMLEIAEEKLKGSANTQFKIVDAMDLPFADDELDLIVCQFGVMFFPDKVASYKEARRVLKPSGRYLFNAWDALSQNPFADLANRLAQDLFPSDPPQFYQVPFHYHDPKQIEDELRQAGFTSISVEQRTLSKTIRSLDVFVECLVRGNPLADELATRGSTPEDFQSRLRAAFVEAFGENPSTMPLSAWFVEAAA